MYHIDLQKDFNGNRFGTRFKDGKGVTKIEWVAEHFRRLGAAVELVSESIDESDILIEQRRTELNNMSVSSLRDMAETLGVKLGSNVRKDNLISLIIKREKFEATASDENDSQDDLTDED